MALNTADAQFLDLTLDVLELSLHVSMERELFLYYRPSSNTEYGTVVLAADVPDGANWALADVRVFRPQRPSDSIRATFRDILWSLPILPYGVAA